MYPLDEDLALLRDSAIATTYSNCSINVKVHPITLFRAKNSLLNELLRNARIFKYFIYYLGFLN